MGGQGGLSLNECCWLLALGLGWQLPIEVKLPIPLGTRKTLPASWALSCAICRIGVWRALWWNEAAVSLSAATEHFSPRPQPFTAHQPGLCLREGCTQQKRLPGGRAVALRTLPALTRTETSRRGSVWLAGLLPALSVPAGLPGLRGGMANADLLPHAPTTRKASTLVGRGLETSDRLPLLSPAPTCSNVDPSRYFSFAVGSDRECSPPLARPLSAAAEPAGRVGSLPPGSHCQPPSPPLPEDGAMLL